MFTIAALLMLLLLSVAYASRNSWSDVLSTTRNDLVFAERNRDYGAYIIRREHHRVMILAFGITMLLLGGVYGVSVLLAPNALSVTDTRHVTEVVLTDMEFTVPKPSAASTPRTATAPRPTPPAPSTGSGLPIAVDSAVALKPDTAQRTGPGPSTGPSTGTLPPGPGTGPAGGGSDGDRDTTVREGWQADVSPEYPGGLEALYADLRKVIRYPATDFERGREGKVFVTFVVTEEGTLTQVSVSKGVSETMNEEALRALRQLQKKWKPGEFQGKRVRVRYNLPINFKLK
jgi:protein TonB